MTGVVVVVGGLPVRSEIGTSQQLPYVAGLPKKNGSNSVKRQDKVMRKQTHAVGFVVCLKWTPEEGGSRSKDGDQGNS